MIVDRAYRYAIRRRGAILMEVLVSIALFVGAGAFALTALRSVLGALDRQQREALAVDLARSKMAELEAGLTTVEQLRDDEGLLDTVGSLEAPDRFDAGADPAWPWEIEVTSSRSDFAGLSLVEITVGESPQLLADGQRPMSFTLRQLVAFGERQRSEAPEDDLLDGVPMEPEEETDDSGEPTNGGGS